MGRPPDSAGFERRPTHAASTSRLTLQTSQDGLEEPLGRRRTKPPPLQLRATVPIRLLDDGPSRGWKRPPWGAVVVGRIPRLHASFSARNALAEITFAPTRQ
jgi:hypothetical protein